MNQVPVAAPVGKIPAKFESKFYAERPSIHDKEVFAELLADFNAKSVRVRKRVPYALFGYLGLERNSQRYPAEQWVPSLHKLQVGTIHGTEHDLKRYLDRGWIVLDYWIPKAEDAPSGITRGDVEVKSGWALEWASEAGKRRRRELEGLLRKAKGDAEELFGYKDREKGLLEKLAAAQAENERLKAAPVKKV